MEKCANCRNTIEYEEDLFYCVVCGATICECCVSSEYYDVCNDCYDEE